MMFGPYQILDQIGSGGMGAVYRARDTRLGREVAVKVLHRHNNVPGARERFLREAQAVSSLSHPNICTVFDIGEEHDEPFLVLELLRGESLKDRIARQACTEAEIREIGVQVALALDAAQQRGIVHRDIKPANLFLVTGPQGGLQVKVLDFGLAKLENDALLRNDGLTRSGATVGTVEYMSPEQARGLDLDPRTDLFSLGAVLYEMATGDVPFRGATSAVVFSELLGSDPLPPRSSNPQLSPEMNGIICGLLEKDRDDRIQTAAELVQLLQHSNRGLLAEPASAAVAPFKLRDFSPAISDVRYSREDLESVHEGLAASGAASKASGAEHATVAFSGELPIQELRRQDTTNEPVRASNGRQTLAEAPSAPPQNVVDPSAPSSLKRSSISKSRLRQVSEDEDDWPEPETSVQTEEVPSVSIAEPAKRSRALIVAAVFVGPALILAVLGYWFLHRHSDAGADIGHGPVLITSFDNQTGDASLDAVPTALRVLLQQVPDVTVLGGLPPLVGAERQTNAAQAERENSIAYLTGSMDLDAGQYRIRAEFRSTEDDSTIAAEEVQAQSAADVPQALNRLAIALRTHLGETAEQASAATRSGDTSISMQALGAFGQALNLVHEGHYNDAVPWLQRASSEDPQFASARITLAEVQRTMGDEVSALATLRSIPNLNVASTCEQHRYAYDANHAESATALKTAQAWHDACPASSAAYRAVAESEMRLGDYAKAESAADAAEKLDPLDREALRLHAAALIAENRFQAARVQLEQMRSHGVTSPGLLLASAYLMHDGQAETLAEADATASKDIGDQELLISFYVNQGQFRNAAAVADRVRSQSSVEGRLVSAQMSAAEAMAGNCSAGDVGIQTATQAALMREIAAAWCHRPEAIPDELHDPALQPVGAALQAWAAGDSARVLSLLQNTHAGPWNSAMTLLRGKAQLLSGHRVQAVDSFEYVLSHRGAAFLSGLPVYPAAEVDVQSAYAAMGDKTNSIRAQRDFAEMWGQADSDLPLLQHGN